MDNKEKNVKHGSYSYNRVKNKISARKAVSNQKERVTSSKFTAGIAQRDAKGVKGFKSTDKVFSKRSLINQHSKKVPVRKPMVSTKNTKVPGNPGFRKKSYVNNTQLVRNWL